MPMIEMHFRGSSSGPNTIVGSMACSDSEIMWRDPQHSCMITDDHGNVVVIPAGIEIPSPIFEPNGTFAKALSKFIKKPTGSTVDTVR